MTTMRIFQIGGRGLAYGTGLAVGAYAAYVGTTWLRYGHAHARLGDNSDPLLDQFIRGYEIVERHQIRVAAPPGVTFAAACAIDLQRSPIINAIVTARERLLGARPDAVGRPHGLVAWAQTLGWGVLAEQPGRVIVLGAVTRPWDANVVFRPVPPEKFAGFNEPNYVKIAWTLRADPAADGESIARTETRAVATDPVARARFRRYWSIFSPGIIVIRYVALRLVKTAAELDYRK
jgi:hypothetical protein